MFTGVRSSVNPNVNKCVHQFRVFSNIAHKTFIALLCWLLPYIIPYPRLNIPGHLRARVFNVVVKSMPNYW